MAEDEKMEKAAAALSRTLDEIKVIAPPEGDDTHAQAMIVEGIIKIAYTYARCCAMPPEVFMLFVTMAMAQVDKIIEHVMAERKAQAQVPMTDEQARELLLHLRAGGRVH